MEATSMNIEDLPRVIEGPELARLRRDGQDVRLIDVRSPAEYASVHIPGSYNVPLDQLGEHRAELGALDAPIVRSAVPATAPDRPRR